MKLKSLKFIIPAILSLTVLVGCQKDDTPSGRPVEAKVFTKYKDDLPAGLNSNDFGGYYKTFDFSLTGRNMLSQIHASCFEKHTTYVLYSNFDKYCSAGTHGPSVDCTKEGEDKIQSFYSGRKVNGTTYSGHGFTREHVWPCAKSSGLWEHNGTGKHNVDGNGYKGGGSDLYHVRPCDSTLNTARGDSKFVYRSDFTNLSFKAYSHKQSGDYDIWFEGLNASGEYANKVEVDDRMKGDLARILAYVYVHYARIGTTPEEYKDYVGGLSLTNIIDPGNVQDAETRVRQILCEWNEIDPPSETEKLRNKTVQGIQGNRNPFVDYPGLMARMFGMDR